MKTDPASAASLRRSNAPVAAVREVDGGLRQDLRGVKVVWQREMIRFAQDRVRAIAAPSSASERP